MGYRYYSTQRPVSPGSYPVVDGNEEVTNFDEITYVDSIGRDAWGFIDYDQDPIQYNMTSYELTKDGTKRWWCVMSSYGTDTLPDAGITQMIETANPPENRSVQSKTKIITATWYDRLDDAKRAVEQTKREAQKRRASVKEEEIAEDEDLEDELEM